MMYKIVRAAKLMCLIFMESTKIEKVKKASVLHIVQIDEYKMR